MRSNRKWTEMLVTPWWEALKIRPEIISSSGSIDDVQMSLFQTVYGMGSTKPLYADPAYYGEITFPSGQLIDLLAKVAVRLGSENYTAAPAVRRLAQGMGGGKSHACVGTWHLGENPSEFAKTDIGKKAFKLASTIAHKPVPHDLNNPHVVVLACDNMTPGVTDDALDGPAANSLYERFLWRLFAGDYAQYDKYRASFNNKSKIAEALKSLHRPVLILIDEVLDYIGNGLDGANKPDLTAQDMAFLRALLDSVNDVPNVAMIVVMIASEKDTIALSKDAEKRRDDVVKLLERNGTIATVNENVDFSAILRRRLFVQPPAAEVMAATAGQFAKAMQDKHWKQKVFDVLAPSAPWVTTWSTEVARTYPFHPQLMHLAENEWANMAGYQKVRSTIRVFAATVYALSLRAESGEWTPQLIGPGDLPLSDAQVRESILSSGLISDTRTEGNYRSIAQSDIVGLDGNSGSARLLDLRRNDPMLLDHNPRAAERAATMCFLASVVGSRSAGRRGASEPELKAATLVPSPNYGSVTAEEIIKDLTDSDAGLGTVEILPGKGGQPPRYFLSTTQTLTILVRAAKNTITDDERDEAIALLAEEMTTTGLFKRKHFVNRVKDASPMTVLGNAGIDDARTTRLVVLDPAAFSLRNGMEKETLEAINSVVGIGPNVLPVEWSASAVFAVVNTQRRQQTRSLAMNYLAHKAALTAPEMAHDPEMRAAGVVAEAEALKALKEKIRSAYQHIVYLSQPEPHLPRTLAVETFDNDLQSALDGTTVWKVLVDKDRAFDQAQFTGPVLLLNLRDEDYGRPLSQVRDSFWSAPRLPLLPAGEDDLRHGIYQAVQSGDLRLLDSSGQPVIVTSASEINLSQSGIVLAKPEVVVPEPTEETTTSQPDEETTKSDDTTVTVTTPQPIPAAEQQVSFTLMHGLANADAAENLAQVFLRLYELADAADTSWVQGTLTLVVDATKTKGILDSLDALGVTANVKDQ